MGLLHFHKYEQKSSGIPLSFNETKVEISQIIITN